MGYLRKSRGTQTMEERQRTSSNLFLKGKLRESIQFVREREKGGVLQPDKLAADRTGKINETVTSVLEGEHLIKTIPSCATLETYEDTPILIPVDITEESVESVEQKLSGSSGPGGTDSEALHGWLLKFVEDITRLCNSLQPA